MSVFLWLFVPSIQWESTFFYTGKGHLALILQQFPGKKNELLLSDTNQQGMFPSINGTTTDFSG